MKKSFLSLVVTMVVCTVSVSAQIDAGRDVGVNYQQLERYIELAKQNYPQRKIAELTEQKAHSVYKAVPLGYLDMLNASYFYRPNDRSAINIDNPYLTNGFQFGVNLNLATFLQRPAQVKQAKFDYEIAKLQAEAYEDVLANEVKKRYYEYQRSREDLGLKMQALEDYKVLAEGLQYRFEKGEIELTDYATAKASVSNAETTLLQARIAILVAQDALEEIIGAKLSEVK